MANGKDVTRTRIGVTEGAGDGLSRKQADKVLLKAELMQKATNSARFRIFQGPVVHPVAK